MKDRVDRSKGMETLIAETMEPIDSLRPKSL
jgi:hypothetical protein